MAEIVYILCAITSAACAFLLLRAFFRTKARLLLWSSVCFITLAINNMVLWIDKAILGPDTDLSLPRTAVATLGLMLLLYGLIWDVEQEGGA
jgi:hypothetical protein